MSTVEARQVFNNHTYLFHDIKIRRFDACDALARRLLDHLHLGPRILVVHEVNRDTLTTKASRSSWTMPRVPSSEFVCHLSQKRWPRTDAVDIRLNIGLRGAIPACTLAIVHEW